MAGAGRSSKLSRSYGKSRDLEKDLLIGSVLNSKKMMMLWWMADAVLKGVLDAFIYCLIDCSILLGLMHKRHARPSARWNTKVTSMMVLPYAEKKNIRGEVLLSG